MTIIKRQLVISVAWKVAVIITAAPVYGEPRGDTGNRGRWPAEAPELLARNRHFQPARAGASRWEGGRGPGGTRQEEERVSTCCWDLDIQRWWNRVLRSWVRGGKEFGVESEKVCTVTRSRQLQTGMHTGCRNRGAPGRGPSSAAHRGHALSPTPPTHTSFI